MVTVDPVPAEGANFTPGLIINALVEDAVVSEAGEVRSLVRSNLLNGNRKLLLRVYRLNLCQVTPSKLVELAEVIAGVVEIAQYEGRNSWRSFSSLTMDLRQLARFRFWDWGATGSESLFRALGL